MSSDGHSGTYPSGTPFEADVFYALQSLVTRPTHADSSNSVIERSTSVQRPTSSSPLSRAPKTRFKPTLNCDQCVQRKTKCDRARPSCLGCVRRAQSCTYNALAEILHASAPAERHSKRQKKSPESQHCSSLEHYTASTSRDAQLGSTQPYPSNGSTPCPPMVLPLDPNLVQPTEPLSNLATPTIWTTTSSQNHGIQSSPTPSKVSLSAYTSAAYYSILPNLAEIPADPPFPSQTSGDMSHVVQALPSKTHAFDLCEIYMRTIDPTIPLFSPHEFFEAHEAFWRDSLCERGEYDPTRLALFLGVYACAAQQSPSQEQREKAQTYLSASHESLVVSNYLQMHSLRRSQALLLICHFLINDSRLIEAWTLAGLAQRQACSLKLSHAHLAMQASGSSEDWQRAQLWDALCHQDNMIACLLKMPRSINSDASSSTFQEQQADEESQATTDRRYHTALARIAAFANEHMFSPTTAATTAREARHICDLLQAIFDSFEAPFQNLDSFWVQNQENSQLARQGIEIMSVFHFHMMLILHMARDSSTAIPSDKLIHCFHEGLAAFFALSDLEPNAARTWSLCHTLSYLQAVSLGKFLGRISRESFSVAPSKKRDPLLMLAKSDFDRYLEALTREANRDGKLQPAADRVRQLRELRKSIRSV
ncbi:hypothetical protein BST61_g9509 [Cercospora zeina]